MVRDLLRLHHCVLSRRGVHAELLIETVSFHARSGVSLAKAKNRCGRKESGTLSWRVSHSDFSARQSVLLIAKDVVWTAILKGIG
jgi:hypothetical protein